MAADDRTTSQCDKVVCTLSVLGFVGASRLSLVADAQANGVLHDESNDSGAYRRVEQNRPGTNRLTPQLF
ncbi:Uncharacterised protein [Mycobacteroides abscessus]|nr:Uncharacterised protein [Mycobacteroides abscessus]